jgi:hypothetical protein
VATEDGFAVEDFALSEEGLVDEVVVVTPVASGDEAVTIAAVATPEDDEEQGEAKESQ